MTPAKRAFDIGFALLLILLLAPVILVVALLITLIDGRPVLYLSERMRTPDTPFCLWKFRTMRVVENDAGVSSGYKQHRVTALGRRLRAYRLDELPQLLNVLRGDMSFVGPRPPPALLCRGLPRPLRQGARETPRCDRTRDAGLPPNRRKAALRLHQPRDRRNHLCDPLHSPQGKAGSDLVAPPEPVLRPAFNLPDRDSCLLPSQGTPPRTRLISKDSSRLLHICYANRLKLAQFRGPHL